MPNLTTDEFIALYKNNPHNALQWIQENETELPTLFTTLEAIIQLGLVTTLKSRDLFAQKLPQELLRDKYQEIRLPIEAWLNRSAAQVATLFQTYAQYIALINASSLIAGELFRKESSRLAALFVTRIQFMELHHASSSLASDVFRQNPSRIAGLFETRTQFMELHHASSSLASDVLRKDPNRIAGLFVTCEQFMELHHASFSLASDVFRQNPSRIAGLFETRTQFMELHHASSSLASDVLRKDPNRIAGLFVTCEQFMELHHASFSLASDVFRQNLSRIAGLFETRTQFMELHHASSALASDVFRKDPSRIAGLFETESQLQQLKSQSTLLANEIAEIRNRTGGALRTSSVIAPDSREKRATVVSRQTRDNSSDRNIKYDHLIKPTPEISYSFYLKCLAGFAILGGGALVITAIILAQPEIAVLGIAVAAIGAIGLYRLFSKPNEKKEAELSDEMLFKV